MKALKKIFIFFLLLFITAACSHSNEKTLKDIVKEIDIPTEISSDYIDLFGEYSYGNKSISLDWTISDIDVINYKGEVTRQDYDQDVTFTIEFRLNDEIVTKEYQAVVKSYSDEEILNRELNTVELPELICSDFTLPQEGVNKNITYSWTSSNPEIIDSEGLVKLSDEMTEVILTLKLSLNSEFIEKEFVVMVKNSKEITLEDSLTYVNDIDDFISGEASNLKVVDKYLTLEEGASQGTYVSPIYNTLSFNTLVGSWSAQVSSSTGSIELKYRLRINNVWSDYVTYGEWSLGKKNYSVSGRTSDGLIKMDEDTVSVLSSKKADAFQYQFIIKSYDIDKNSEIKVLLVGTTINSGLSDIERPTLKHQVLYDVPKLCQKVVSNIGGSICSPTSTTMLLKYHGHSFTDYGYDYEHEYMANVVYDYGASIYGNWT